MDIISRLNDIEKKIVELKTANEKLGVENQQLNNKISALESDIETKEDAINNLEEQNKIAKLAGGLNENSDSSAIKAELEGLIHEIDQCIKLVKQ